MTTLARQVCPICASDEDYSVEVEGPGLWRLTCARARSDHPYSWVTTGQGALDHSGEDGVAASLGLYDDLLAVISHTDPWLEYGIVEYRYALAVPDTYRHLVDQYGHVAIAPKRYTASAFIGAALGKLRRETDLAYKPCTATGRWSYNGQISAWATNPGPADPAILTWAAFAVSSGFDPETWPPLS